MSNIRPVGRIRPAVRFYPARIAILSTLKNDYIIHYIHSNKPNYNVRVDSLIFCIDHNAYAGLTPDYD